MTVENLLDGMTAAEFTDWQAFYRVEPFGDEWRQTGEICAMVGNAAGGKRNGGSFTPRDFLPIKPLLKHIYAGCKQTGAQMLAAFKLLAVATKGK